MDIAIVLLAIIASVELARLVLTFKPTTKAGHFKQKLEGTQKMVWDMEFKLFKTREVREDIRRLYDSKKAERYNVEQQQQNWATLDNRQVKDLKPEELKELIEKDKLLNTGEYKRLQDRIDLLTRDIQRLEMQLKVVDMEIDGSKPTAEYPDGATGITQQIDSLQEVVGMLKDWLKQGMK